MMTRSPAWMSTCLWVEKAIRVRQTWGSRPLAAGGDDADFVLGKSLDKVKVHQRPSGTFI